MQSTHVLAAGQAMNIEEHLEAVVPCPANCVIQMRKLSLDVWVAALGHKSPVADRNADVVEAGSGNCSKVALLEPGRPMRVESVVGFLRAESLRVAVLVDDTVAV